MLAYDDELTTHDLVHLLNVPIDAIPSVVREAGLLLTSRSSGASAARDT